MGSRFEGGKLPVPHPVRRFLRRARRKAFAVTCSESSRTKGMLRSPLDRMIPKRNRSYKLGEYLLWCAKYNGIKRPTKGGG